MHIDKKRTLYPAAAGFGHPPPVFKGVRNKGVEGHRGNGLVPVLNLYGIQADVDHISVLVHRPHPVGALTADSEEHLIEVPGIAQAGAWCR